MTEVVRSCPDCGEEYQPHVTTCVECGGVLEDKLADDAPEEDGLPPVDPNLPPGEYRKVADGLTAATAERLVKLFIGAGIPVMVESLGYGLCVSSRFEDRPEVLAMLEREGVIPKPSDAEAPAVGTEGGACPACGTPVPAGSLECPDCGLLLGGAGCESCGAELAPSDQACPACGHVVSPG